MIDFRKQTVALDYKLLNMVFLVHHMRAEAGFSAKVVFADRALEHIVTIHDHIWDNALSASYGNRLQ